MRFVHHTCSSDLHPPADAGWMGPGLPTRVSGLAARDYSRTVCAFKSTLEKGQRPISQLTLRNFSGSMIAPIHNQSLVLTGTSLVNDFESLVAHKCDGRHIHVFRLRLACVPFHLDLQKCRSWETSERSISGARRSCPDTRSSPDFRKSPNLALTLRISGAASRRADNASRIRTIQHNLSKARQRLRPTDVH